MIDVLAIFFDINTVRAWMEAGGYFLLFGLLFACGLGLPLPEDIPLLLGGYFVAHGKMHLLPAAVLAWCGIIGGDCVLYHFGKKYGLNITRVPFVGKHVTRERIERAEHLFERYGIWVVAVGRLFAGIRGGMVVAAGTIRFKFIKFIIADGLAALVSGGMFMGLGMWVGSKIGDLSDDAQRQQFMNTIKPFKEYVFAGAVVLAMGLIVYIWWRRKKHHAIVDVVAEKIEHEAQTHGAHRHS